MAFDDDWTIPSRAKSGARKAVREIIVCVALGAFSVCLFFWSGGMNAGIFFPLVFALPVGIALWSVYRVIRFAIGR